LDSVAANKTKVKVAIIQFYNMVETQFKTKIQLIRSDNQTEFINGFCHEFFSSKGILYQKSIAKTPQQNRVVEKKYRHLLETARAIRFQAGLPKHF